jgi:hypothetical protein
MSNISPQFAIESLWQALSWEPLDPTKMFDRIAARLRRNPMFHGLSIGQLDLILGDARQEFECDMDEHESRLIRAFEDALEHNETDGVAA